MVNVLMKNMNKKNQGIRTTPEAGLDLTLRIAG
jgi:hypothetical protein